MKDLKPLRGDARSHTFDPSQVIKGESFNILKNNFHFMDSSNEKKSCCLQKPHF